MERKCQEIIFVITKKIIRDFKILKCYLLNSKSCVYSSICQNFVIKILTKRAQKEFAFLCWLARALRKKCPKNGVFSGPYFPVFVLNEEIYSGSLHIQFECRKIRTRKNSVTLFTLWRQNVFQNYFPFWTSIIKNHLQLKILSFSDRKYFLIFNPLSANSVKWSNTLKQFISKLSHELFVFV